MDPIYLERHDPDKNIHRFYQMYVMPGIFGDWSLVREWGRVGSPGTVRKEWFASEAEAVIAGEKLSDVKRKKGYRSRLGECPKN
jgi:predicted DNA-binding WGR domain protein